MSLEFLIGRLLIDSLTNLGLVEPMRAALAGLDIDLDKLRQVEPDAVHLVNAVLERRRPTRLELDGTAIRIGHRHTETPVDDALALIAEAIVEELATGRPERLRVCANDRCRWAFYDSSPTGRRRWCDMRSCGNQAKAARHRARLRGGAGEAEHDHHGDEGPTARPN